MIQEKNYLITGIVILVAYLIWLIFELPTGFYYDIASWQNWSIFISKEGLSSAYDHPDINYLPLYLYVLHIYEYFTGSEAAIKANIYYLKDFTILIELFSLLLILIILKKFRKNPYWLLLLLLNPAFWYNSAIWGQVDGIHTAFVLACIIGFLSGNIIAAGAFLILAFNMKLQTIIFLPLIIFISLPTLVKNRGKIIPAIAVAILIQFIILIPFLNNLNQIWQTITGSIDYYPFASMNAFNFWHLILEGNPMDIYDSTQFWGISYKQWGIFFFFGVSVLILLPIFLKTIIALFQSRPIWNKKMLELSMLSAAMVAMTFFFFNTQMHERYMHPAIIFSGFYAILSNRWFAHLLFSLGYFLNLEKLLMAFNLKMYEYLIFDEEFIAIILFTGMAIALAEIYKNYLAGLDLKEILSHIKKGRGFTTKKAAERQL